LPYGIDETSSEEDSDMDEFEAESEAEAETAELDPTTEEPVNVETDPSSNYPTLLTPDCTLEPNRRDNNASSPTMPQEDPYVPMFTPESTHEVDPESEFEARHASREIIGDVDPRNIVTGSRTRRPTSRRREAYVTDLQVPEEFPGFYDAFAIGLGHTNRLHHDNLPPPPKNWREMQSHPQKEGFLDAANREISELQGKETFKYVERPKGTQIVPLL